MVLLLFLSLKRSRWSHRHLFFPTGQCLVFLCILIVLNVPGPTRCCGLHSSSSPNVGLFRVKDCEYEEKKGSWCLWFSWCLQHTESHLIRINLVYVIVYSAGLQLESCAKVIQVKCYGQRLKNVCVCVCARTTRRAVGFYYVSARSLLIYSCISIISLLRPACACCLFVACGVFSQNYHQTLKKGFRGMRISFNMLSKTAALWTAQWC